MKKSVTIKKEETLVSFIILIHFSIKPYEQNQIIKQSLQIHIYITWFILS